MGVLHGLPVSLMDRFHVGGLDSACGFAGWAGRTRNADDEGTLLRALRTLGAVVHCKTNVPMSLMLGEYISSGVVLDDADCVYELKGETSNNVIGTTTNPYNASFSAGGACGGEGALLALHGSALGLGTDIAGSSRIPSAFCGLWALKCSEHRLPNDGLATVLTGLPLAMGSIGLMAREPDVLELSLKALLTSNLALSDPEVIPLPWRQADLDSIMRRKASPKEQDGRLTFAVMYDDGHVQPHPPIQRALAIVSDALRQSGYEVIEWKPPAHAPAVENLFKILGSTAAAEARAAIDSSGEPPIPQLAEWYQHEDMAPNTTTEFWSLCERRHQFRKEYKAHWNQVGETSTSGRAPDGVILPVAPSLAVRPGGFRYYGYSAIANVLDYPSGVFPVTFGDRQLDIQHSKLTPLNELDREVQEMCEFSTDSYRCDGCIDTSSRPTCRRTWHASQSPNHVSTIPRGSRP